MNQIKVESEKERQKIEKDFQSKIEEMKKSLIEENQKEKNKLNQNMKELKQKYDSLSQEKSNCDREIERLNGLMTKAKILKNEYQKVLQQRDEAYDKFEKFKVEIEMKYEKEKEKLKQQLSDNQVIERSANFENDKIVVDNENNDGDDTKEKYLQSVLINFFEQDETSQLHLVPVILKVAGCSDGEIRRILKILDNKRNSTLLSKAKKLFE